jgi:hypothetical protein
MRIAPWSGEGAGASLTSWIADVAGAGTAAAWVDVGGGDAGAVWPDIAGAPEPASWSLDGKPVGTAAIDDDDVELDPAEVAPFVIVVLAILAYLTRGMWSGAGRRGAARDTGDKDSWIDPARDRTGVRGGKAKKKA